MATMNEQALKGVKAKRDEISAEAQTILDAQSTDQRQLSEEENAKLAECVRNMKTLDKQEADLKEAVKLEKEVLGIGREIGHAESKSLSIDSINDVKVTGDNRSLGQIFVESEGFKSAQDAGSGARFSTGAVELSTKGTLLTGPGAPGTGTGGALLTVPQVVPGVVEKLFQTLTVADIIATGTTNTNTLRYVVEGTATSGAAGVAEGAAKPESLLALNTVDEPVKKLATVLHVSDEMLEDAAQVESYINGRLSLFIRIKEEDSLVNGAGTNDLVGINGRTGVNIYAGGTVDNNAVVLFKAINGTRGSAFLEPDAIIMNPTDWQETRLLMDANQQFYGGGPFSGQYGNGGVDPISGQLTGATDTIWNKPVLVTTAIGVGTALLGSFRTAAQIFRKGGLTVEASNSHDLHFTKNLVAIRAEQRLALAVYRPSAFTRVLFQ